MPKKVITISIITVIILTLFGGGVFWYVKQGEEIVNTPIVGDETEQVIADVQDTTIESNESILKKVGVDENGWNIYQSEKYGFELKVPDYFSIKDFLKSNSKHLDAIRFSDKNIETMGLYISINTTNDVKIDNEIDFLNWLCKYRQYPKLECKKYIERFLNNIKIGKEKIEFINIEDKDIIKSIELDSPDGSTLTFYYLFEDNSVYSFIIDNFYYEDEQEAVFLDIIKSFRTDL